MLESVGDPIRRGLGPRTAAWVVTTGSVLASLDLFVVNLALPAVGASFPGASERSLSWIVSGYTIVFAALLVPAGRMADRYGRRRVHRLGLAVFAAASGACAAAPSVWVLVAARGVQGAGAALMVPTSLALLLAAQPAERHKRVLSHWAAAGSVAAAVGPAVGGLLVDVDWRLVFLLSVLLAAPAVALAGRLTESRTEGRRVPDLWGSALLVVCVAALVEVILTGSDRSAGPTGTAAAAVVATAAGAAFVRRAHRVAVPVVDLRLFGEPGFAAASAGMVVFYAGFAALLLGFPLLLTEVWGVSASQAGLWFAVSPAAAVLASVLGGRSPLAPAWLTVTGATLFAASGLWWALVLTRDAPDFWLCLPGLLATGAGAGVTQPGLLAGGARALPAPAYATGTGVLNAGRQIGAALGVGLFVALAGAARHATDLRPVWLLMCTTGGIAAVLAAALATGAPAPQRREPPPARPALPVTAAPVPARQVVPTTQEDR